MRKFKAAAASLASLAIITLTPVAAHADACNECYGGCIDAYGDDNSESGYYQLSQCVNWCEWNVCMATLPGGG